MTTTKNINKFQDFKMDVKIEDRKGNVHFRVKNAQPETLQEILKKYFG